MGVIYTKKIKHGGFIKDKTRFCPPGRPEIFNTIDFINKILFIGKKFLGRFFLASITT